MLKLALSLLSGPEKHEQISRQLVAIVKNWPHS